MNRFYLIITIIFLSLSISESFSQSGKVLNLDECLEIAQKKNFNIRLIRPGLSSAEANLLSARSAYFPSVSISAGYSKSEITNEQKAVGISGETYSARVSGNINLFDGLAREARITQAENNLESRIAGNDQIKSKVSIDVYTKYVDVVKNYRIVEIRKENIKSGQQDLDRTRAMNQAGALAIGELYGAEADLGNRKLELVTAENTLEISKYILLSAIGLDLSGDYEFDIESIPSSLTQEEIDAYTSSWGRFENLYGQALDSRDDYLASDFDIKASKAGIKSARSTYFPSLTASAGWGGGHTEISKVLGELTYNYGLGISIPIFTGFSTNRAIEQANLLAEQTRIANLELEYSIKREIQLAILNLRASSERFEIANTTVKSAKLNYDSSLERFRLGAANITELSTSNTQLISAQISLINSVYDFYRAQKELEYGVGDL